MARNRHDSSPRSHKALALIVLVGMAVVAGLNRTISASVSRPGTDPGAAAAMTETASVPPTGRGFRKELRAKPYLDYSGNPAAADKRVSELTAQSGGDVTRLSIEDRTWLESMSAGRAAEMLRSRAHDLKNAGKRAGKK